MLVCCHVSVTRDVNNDSVMKLLGRYICMKSSYIQDERQFNVITSIVDK